MKIQWWLTIGLVLTGSLAWAQGRVMGGTVMNHMDKLLPVKDYSVTMLMDAGGQTISTKTFKLGKKMRVEIAQQGFQMVTLLDPDADDGKGAAYVLMPMMKTYMKQPAPPAATAPADNVDIQTEELGKEDVDGVPCDKRRVTITDNGTTYTITLWASPKDKDMPVKMEMAEPNKVIIRYKDYDFTKPAADLFTLPADYKAGDFGGMAR